MTSRPASRDSASEILHCILWCTTYRKRYVFGEDLAQDGGCPGFVDGTLLAQRVVVPSVHVEYRMDIRRIILAASLVALNVVLGKVAATFSLPVYLDTVGTILAGALLPWPFAVAVGVSTSAVAGVVIHPAYWYYFFTQAVVASVAVLLLRQGAFGRVWTAALAGLVIAVCAAIVSAPVTVVAFGGVTLSGTTAINAVLLASGQSIWKAVLGGSLIIESLDKVSAAVLAWLVLRRLPADLLTAR